MFNPMGRNYPSFELLTQRPANLGKVFFVDSGGSDDNEGTDPNFPMKLMTTAIAKCNSVDHGDTIVVMQESPGSPTSGETWPILINKPGILLTGLYSRGLVSDSGFSSTPVNTNCINIANGTNFVSVENLYLQTLTGTTTGDVVSCPTVGGAAIYGFTMRNCVISIQNACRYGFYTNSNVDWPYLLIEDCQFGSAVGSYMTNAIRIWNATYGIIRRNLFGWCSSYAMYGLGNGGFYNILDNKFNLSANTAGFAIQLDSGSQAILVDGNSATSQKTATGVSVYTDASSGGNRWGNNYAGIVAVLSS